MTSDYRNTSSVDEMTLISMVKKNEHLYNRNFPGYTDLRMRDETWNEINGALFPNYDNLPKKTRKIISKTVRKRWKSLRYSVIKEMKRKIDNPDYERTLPNPLLEELNFLTPYVRPHFLAENNTVEEENEEEKYESPIYLYEDTKRSDSPVSIIDSSGSPPTSLAEPEIQIHSYNSLKPFAKFDIANNGLFIEEQNKELQKQNIQQHNEEYRIEEHDGPLSSPIPPPTKRRKRLSSKDFQLEIVQILKDCERHEEESRDSDRMFLLSLLADLKQIPAQKKIFVKAQMLAALAHGWSD